MEPRIQHAKTGSVHSGPGANPATLDHRYRLTSQISLQLVYLSGHKVHSSSGGGAERLFSQALGTPSVVGARRRVLWCAPDRQVAAGLGAPPKEAL